MAVRAFFIIAFLMLAMTGAVYADEGIGYTTQISGVYDTTLRGVIESNSSLFTLQSKKPSSLLGLRIRIEEDLPEILETLHSYGYYSARIQYEMLAQQSPVQVVLYIEPGPQYTFSHFALLPPMRASDAVKDSFEEVLSSVIDKECLAIRTGNPAYARDILGTEQTLLDTFAKAGYPFAKFDTRQVVVDQATKTVDVTLYFDPGPLSCFGSVTFSGLHHVDPQWLIHKVAIRPGDRYSPELISETRRGLEDTGLFSTIEIVTASEPAQDGCLPVTIALVENKQRSILFGVSYTTDQSVGGVAAWEHRNLRGKGEHLTLKALVNQVKWEANIQFRKPDFRRRNEDFIWQLQYKKEFLKSYDDTAISGLVAIERKASPRLFYSYGAKLEELSTFQDGEKQHFTLFSLPFKLKWQRVNNPTFPSYGCVVDFRFSPYTDFADMNNSFTVQKATTTFFYPVISHDSLVLMSRFSIGAIAASKNSRVPPSIRFYEGSYGGLRGYTYQTVSPLDSDNRPIGGRSLLLYGIESRIKLNDQFFFIPFYDLGNVYANPWPDFRSKLLRSWGCGLCYVSMIGPLRVDVAFPLDRRPNLDKKFIIYFSMGATF